MEYTIRPATLKDINFLIEAIIQAEKSGTDKLGLATLFNLTEQEVRTYLYAILEEEINGCELSISSFLVAEFDGECVTAVGGWKESDNEDGLPSGVLKANLIGFFFPPESITFAKSKSDIIKDIQIDRTWGSYQIEYVYVDKNHRGKNLTAKLINAHIDKAKAKGCTYCYVQVFGDNQPAINSYKKIGFELENTFTSKNKEIVSFLPYYQKILMRINI